MAQQRPQVLKLLFNVGNSGWAEKISTCTPALRI
jgi:hypothetical protein